MLYLNEARSTHFSHLRELAIFWLGLHNLITMEEEPECIAIYSIFESRAETEDWRGKRI